MSPYPNSAPELASSQKDGPSFAQSLPADPFDIVIIGGGPGGYVAAIRAAQLGFKTALIEGKHLGGVCLNWGCIPTKALLKSASMLDAASHMSDFGLHLPQGDVTFDLQAMIQRSRKIAGNLQAGVKGLLSKNKVSVFSAWAKFMPVSAEKTDHSRGHTPTKQRGDLHTDHGPDHNADSHPNQDKTADNKTSATASRALELTNTAGEKGIVRGKKIIIATGARARTLFPEDLNVWSAHHAMTPSFLPKSLLIIGAGAIGVEFASFYTTLGTQVTLVEQSPTILSVEDAEIVDLATQSFKKQGMQIETQSVAKNVVKHGEKSYTAMIVHQETGVETPWSGEQVLVAIGVIGNTEQLGLEHTAVKVKNGHIVTHDYSITDELDVYAIGDVAGAPWLAHKASHEGISCVEYIAKLSTHPMDTTLIPGCTYSMPQIASIGLTEAAAAAKGSIKVGRFPFSANGQAMAYGESTGLVKVIFDQETGELLGAHMIGAGVSELIQGFAIAKTLQATEADLKRVIFPHPTFSEMMHEAILDADVQALHLFRPNLNRALSAGREVEKETISRLA